MNKTILLAAGFALALAFTVSCSSDDKDDGNGGGGGTPAGAAKYCKVNNYCLEMPESECSVDLYKGLNGNEAKWGGYKYEVVNECASITVACWRGRSQAGTDCVPGNTKSQCERLSDKYKAFNTVKECLDYVPPPGPLCLYTSGGIQRCERSSDEDTCTISLRGEIVEACP
jgi:hypothetical protein